MPKLTATFSAHAMHRPLFMLDWATEQQPWLAVHWGDPNSDPVWSIEWQPGPLVSRLIGWAVDRRRKVTS